MDATGMAGAAETSWFDITRRTARSVQTTIGWIFWEPGAAERYQALGRVIPGTFDQHRIQEPQPGAHGRRFTSSGGRRE